MKLQAFLKKLHACQDAKDWVGDKSWPEAWETCEHPDWMLWLCGRMIGNPGWPSHQDIVLAACDCAELTLPIFAKKCPDDKRPQQAIQTARDWVEGKASLQEVRIAAWAAADADDAAEAADADEADEAAWAARAAAWAAWAAADADDAAEAARAAAWAKRDMQLKCCDLIRKRLKITDKLT